MSFVSEKDPKRMKYSFIKWLLKPAYSLYSNLTLRLDNLETVVKVLLAERHPLTVSNDFGFNGQQYRKSIFRDLLEAFRFQTILETGTFFGNTTAFMANNSKLPVYSCEANKLFLEVARNNLSALGNVSLLHCDSRDFLRQMAHTDISKLLVFIYLDAHLGDDLPLKEEIEIICDNFRDFMMMIDDFEVPYDAGYGFDDYGMGKTLNFKTFSKIFAQHNLIPFGPAISSSEESGYKRGCVILGKQGKNSEILSGIKSLHIVNC